MLNQFYLKCMIQRMIGIFCRISVLYVLCVNYSVNKKFTELDVITAIMNVYKAIKCISLHIVALNPNQFLGIFLNQNQLLGHI